MKGEISMYGSERTLYPMLGVGAFFVMFWVGFVVSYELGLACWMLVFNAFASACMGAWFVARLQIADEYPGAYRPAPEAQESWDTGGTKRPVLMPRFFIPTGR
jgi:hypothetical protein